MCVDEIRGRVSDQKDGLHSTSIQRSPAYVSSLHPCSTDTLGHHPSTLPRTCLAERLVSPLSRHDHHDVSTLFRTQNLIGFQSLLIGQWREIAIRGMAALTVIEHFDVFKHSCLGVFVRVKPLQINQLGL